MPLRGDNSGDLIGDNSSDFSPLLASSKGREGKGGRGGSSDEGGGEGERG